MNNGPAQATAEANNLTAVAEAREVYTALMEEVCGGGRPYLQAALLEAEHARVRDKALHAFHAKRKMGGDEFSQAYCDQLVHVRSLPRSISNIRSLFKTYVLYQLNITANGQDCHGV